MKRSLLLLCFLFFSSCSTQKKDLPERIIDLLEKQAKIVSDTVLEEKIDEEAKLPEHFNLAVYFRPSSRDQWRWTQTDKQRVLTTVEGQKGDRIQRVFELINTSTAEGPVDTVSLRNMALQQGADALLLVQGVAEVATHLNPWAVSYLAIVPAFFVEGNDVSAVFLSQAILWDTRKSHVHLGVQSEGDWTMERPAVFKQEHRAIRKSKEEALNVLSSKLKKNFQDVIL